MDRLLEQEIVPDVLGKLPTTASLHIQYSDSNHVNFGNQLKIQDVENPPISLNWEDDADPDPNSFYTICLTDPDAPSRSDPKMRERVHWLVGNIPGTGKSWKEKEGDELIAYVPSCPPTGSGLHRYTFVLLRQPGRLDFGSETKIDTSKEMWDLRRAFSIRAWAKRWKCEVHAANFYVAEWDLTAQKTRDRLGL